jgi:hypothetical protein
MGRRAAAWTLAFLLMAATRLLTIAPDPWHWDEVLLTDAVAHGIDLRAHRPHPPGYPLLVELSRVVRLTGTDAYRSLAVVASLGGILAPIALAWLLREAGLSSSFACAGGLLYAFFPSIWLHGVRGFSDAPAAAFYFASCAAFLGAARRERAAGIAVGLVLASVAAGVRPQCAAPLLPIALVSSLPALRARERRVRGLFLILLGAFSAALLSAAVWWPAVSSSGGWSRFREAFAIQAAGVYLQPVFKLTSWATCRRWLVDPLGTDAVFWVAAALSIVGLLSRFRASARILLVVLPWAVLNMPFSPPFDGPRYGAVLLGALAGLAAAGLEFLSRRSRPASALLAAAMIGTCAFTGVGAVVEVAQTPSPTCAAIRLLGTEPYARGTAVHDEAIRMHLERLLPGRARGEIVGDRPVFAVPGDVLVLADRHVPGLSSPRRFAFSHALLRRISRGSLLSVEVGLVTAPLSVGFREAPANAPTVRYDANIPVSIDSPANGAVVRRELVVQGWCQLRGGSPVEPVEFRLDGVVARVVSLERFPRPEVAVAIPEIGDASKAGYRARLDPGSLAPGTHVLVVAFRAFDGRERIFPPVRFTWVP